MSRNRIWLVLLLAACVLIAVPAAFAVETPETTGNVPYLFVQSADYGSFNGTELVLNSAGTTIFFSDRPFRVEGQVKTEKFVEAWAKGSDSFKADPPNATLSIFGANGVTNAVVELADPKMVGDSISYTVRVLEGTIPPSFQAASLFLDRGGDAGWGAAGGLLGGILLSKALDNSQPAQPQVTYVQQPVYAQPQPNYMYYHQAPPAACPQCPPCQSY